MFLLGFLQLAAAVEDSTVAGPGNLYPQPSFQRVLWADDPYTNAYCLNTGEPGVVEGSESQKYRAVQSCYHGRVAAWPCTGADYPTSPCMSFSSVSAASHVDLGTLSDISTRYGLSSYSSGDVFGSIRWNNSVFPTNDIPAIYIAAVDQVGHGSITEFQPLIASDWTPMAATSSEYPTSIFEGEYGHVYLVRIGSASDWTSGTDQVIKLMFLEQGNDSASVRWNLFYSGTEDPQLVDNDDGGDDDSEAEKAESSASAALGMGVTAFLLSLAALLAVWCTRRQTSSGLSGSAQTTDSYYGRVEAGSGGGGGTF